MIFRSNRKLTACATQPLHIAIDAHSVGARLGGNETYAINLIEALAEIDQTNLYTLYVTKRDAIERFANRWPNFTVKQTLPHTPLVRIPLTLSRELRRNPVDVLHVQYTAPPLAPCPIVTTIHDLAFEHLPETFNRRSWMQLRLTVRRTARQSAQIITVSEYSRQDILNTYRIPSDQITVTPEAASEKFFPVTDAIELKAVRETYGIERDYILSLCSIQPRKNLIRSKRILSCVNLLLTLSRLSWCWPASAAGEITKRSARCNVNPWPVTSCLRDTSRRNISMRFTAARPVSFTLRTLKDSDCRSWKR